MFTFIGDFSLISVFRIGRIGDRLFTPVWKVNVVGASHYLTVTALFATMVIVFVVHIIAEKVRFRRTL